MLHLIFKSPLDPVILERMAPGDYAVFLDSAVFGLLKKGRAPTLLTQHSQDKRLYVLVEDLLIRGIAETELTPGLHVIDYQQLVDLTVAYTPIQSWN